MEAVGVSGDQLEIVFGSPVNVGLALAQVRDQDPSGVRPDLRSGSTRHGGCARIGQQQHSDRSGGRWRFGWLLLSDAIVAAELLILRSETGDLLLQLVDLRVLPMVERFFAERIFGPMRLDKLARQLQAHEKRNRRDTDTRGRHLREEVADLDRRIGRQIEALEQGVEPELIAKRIAKLRNDKEKAEIELRALEPRPMDRAPTEDASALLARLPDLGLALHHAPAELKRQVFDAFQLTITYDKVERRIEISATITEAVAQTLENAKDLPKEVSSVAHRDIAGARFVPRSDGRITQEYSLAALIAPSTCDGRIYPQGILRAVAGCLRFSPLAIAE